MPQPGISQECRPKAGRGKRPEEERHAGKKQKDKEKKANAEILAIGAKTEIAEKKGIAEKMKMAEKMKIDKQAASKNLHSIVAGAIPYVTPGFPNKVEPYKVEPPNKQ
ncbi:MAG: hypothetical protein AB1847_08765 [bacterium]